MFSGHAKTMKTSYDTVAYINKVKTSLHLESTVIPVLSGEIAIDRARTTKGTPVIKDTTLQSVSATSSLHNKWNDDHKTNNELFKMKFTLPAFYDKGIVATRNSRNVRFSPKKHSVSNMLELELLEVTE